MSVHFVQYIKSGKWTPHGTMFNPHASSVYFAGVCLVVAEAPYKQARSGEFIPVCLDLCVRVCVWCVSLLLYKTTY